MNEVEHVSPSELDTLLSQGWRHSGTTFFRHSYDHINDTDLCHVLPLRVKLDGFDFTPSQKRILRKNLDLVVKIRPIEITLDTLDLFDTHKEKFTFRQPDSIFNFISQEPSEKPCNGMELCLYKGDKLLACSYFDEGENSCSGVYAFYDLNEGERSLGILTMMLELLNAKKTGKAFYYPGYAYDVPSFYDYKKRFANTQFYDWLGHWIPLKRLSGSR
jgi:leucyl-tRNA---protein transferase